MNLSLKTFFAAAPFLFAATSHAAVVIDFETGTELASQFHNGNLPATYTQTSNGGGNDVLNFTQGSGAPGTLFFDANGPAAGSSAFSVSQGNPLTVTATVVLPTANGSFGISFSNPFNEANAYLALFNVNYASGNGTTDQFRFDNAFNALTGGVGSLGGGTTGDAGVTIGSSFNISVTYSILSSNTFQLSMTVGSITTTSAIYTGTPLSQVQVGIRTNPVGGTGTLDNINISGDPVTVPETSSALLALAGACGVMSRRRR